MPSPSTSFLASDAVAKLKKFLWREPQSQIYAIVDAARSDGIYPMMAQETDCLVLPLFRGELASELALVGPYLVVLKPDAILTGWLLGGWGSGMAIFAEADAPLERVRRHFRSLLVVKSPDGRTIYFRYYDPEVLRNYLPTCNDKELEVFFYHETRHAEQWSLIARRQAAEGASVEQIQTQLFLPEKVAKQAVKHPLTSSDSRKACGDALHKSVYGENAAARNTTITNLEQQGAAVNIANEEYKNAIAEEKRLQSQLAVRSEAYWARTRSAHPPTTAELDALSTRYYETEAKFRAAQTVSRERFDAAQSAYSTYQRTYADYRALPEEADAWNSGGRASDAIKTLLASP